jgi:hypothetical protein
MIDFDLDEKWVEWFIILFLLLGFFLAVILRSPTFSYLSLLLAGALAGRILYIKYQKEPILPFLLIIVGFLLGYLLGSFWVNRLLAFIVFALAFGLSYYLHLKRIIVIFKSERFIK